MNDLNSMFRSADDQGECIAEIDPGVYVEELRIAVESEGYTFKTDGRMFSVIASRQPINYPKAGTV